MAGKDKAFLSKLGADKELKEKAHKYFAGTMTDARRLMQPVKPTEPKKNCFESDEEYVIFKFTMDKFAFSMRAHKDGGLA